MIPNSLPVFFFSRFLLLCIAGSLFSACADTANPNDEQRSGAEGYIRGTLEKGDEARVTTALITVRQAINHFEIQEGNLPESLEELVDQEFLPTLPRLPHNQEFHYDPSTGKVDIRQTE